MRKLLVTAALTAAAAVLGLGATADAGPAPVGYTLNFTSATLGDTDDLVATLTGGDCDLDLRIGLYQSDGTTQVTDNGNGGVTDATQIALTNPGSLVSQPGDYLIRVTCGGTPIGTDTPFEVRSDVVQPPVDPPVDPGPDTGPVAAVPTYTG